MTTAAMLCAIVSSHFNLAVASSPTASIENGLAALDFRRDRGPDFERDPVDSLAKLNVPSDDYSVLKIENGVGKPLTSVTMRTDRPKLENPGSSKVKVIQKNGRASVPGLKDSLGPDVLSEKDLLNVYDEVQVVFTLNDDTHSIELELPPEYKFAEKAEGDSAALFLSSGNKHLNGESAEANDIVSAGIISRVRLVSDGPKQKAIVELDPEKVKELRAKYEKEGKDASQDVFQYFTIMIENPKETPPSSENQFQVTVKNRKDEELEKARQPGLQLKQPWVCSYSAWKKHSTCTARCGGGFRYETRKLLNPPPSKVDKALLVNCNEELSRREACNKHPCEMDCHLGEWIRWSDGPCSASCNGGWEVQRRHVVHAATSGGEACPSWNGPERVRYLPCNTDACPEHCEVAESKSAVLGVFGDPHLNPAVGVKSPDIISDSCSRYCGSGTLKISSLIHKTLKHSGDACESSHTEQCNEEPCGAFDFFPARPGHLPEVGKWYEVVMLFVLKDMADTITIEPPPDFEIFHDEDRTCYIVEHDLPRLRECEILEKSNVARLSFSNPLEPQLPNKEFPAQYGLRLWVKSPKTCDTTADDICSLTSERKTWTMTIRADFPQQTLDVEQIHGGYDIYTSQQIQKLHIPVIPQKRTHRDVEVAVSRGSVGLAKPVGEAESMGPVPINFHVK